MPERSNGWWVSPAIPTIANGVLALLWLFSAVGGWGESAFCGEGGDRDLNCADEFAIAVLMSVFPAVAAAGLVVFAWSARGVRHRPDRLDAMLTVAAFGWVLAEAILFAGGYLGKP